MSIQSGAVRHRRHAVAVGVAGAMVLALTGCGTSRTPAAFCAEYRHQKSQYLSKYDSDEKALKGSDSMTQVFGGLALSIEALGDIVQIFDHLDKVAPNDIEPDVAAIRDALKKQIDAAGNSASNPLGGLLGGLISGLTTEGSWTRVNTYVVKHCDKAGE